MQVNEVMNKNIQVITPDVEICQAARFMRDGDFGVIPVSENQKVIGMVTDRDIAIRAVADELSLHTPVRDVMTTQVLTCYEDDDVSKVSKLMADNQVRRIVVLDHNEDYVGIVSLGDLSLEHEEKAQEALKNISQPQHNEPSTTARH